jgi:hypothetical protein
MQKQPRQVRDDNVVHAVLVRMDDFVLTDCRVRLYGPRSLTDDPVNCISCIAMARR